jgi:hypothetical protein
LFRHHCDEPLCGVCRSSWKDMCTISRPFLPFILEDQVSIRKIMTSVPFFLRLCMHLNDNILISGALSLFGGSDATTHYYMLHPHQQLRQVGAMSLQYHQKVQVTSFRAAEPPGPQKKEKYIHTPVFRQHTRISSHICHRQASCHADILKAAFLIANTTQKPS